MHEGHRKRMYEKLKNSGTLYDHEILEIFLFNAYPRTNTNPVAHALLQAFGSLQGVLNADPEQLMQVKGVGESVAYYLKCAGECFSRINGNTVTLAVKNFKEFQDFAAMRLRGYTTEVLELYFLDKNGKVIYVDSHTSESLHSVEVNPEQLSAVIAKMKSSGLFLAHNHLGGDSKPSQNDDDFTQTILKICQLNGTKLYDHVIYATEREIFSYYLAGRLDELRRKAR